MKAGDRGAKCEQISRWAFNRDYTGKAGSKVKIQGGNKMGIYQKVKEKILGLIYDDVEEDEKCWNSMLEWKKEHQKGKLK